MKKRFLSILLILPLLGSCGRLFIPLSTTSTSLISAQSAGIREKIRQSLAESTLRERPLAEPGDESPKAQRQLLDTYEEQAKRLLPKISTKQEVAESDRFFEDFFMKEDNDPSYVQKGQKILDRLMNAGIRREISYRIGVMNADDVSAFGKGGALLVVSEGVLDLSEAEAAAVIAHELAHNEHRHYLRSMLASEINRLFKGQADQLLALSLARLDRQFEYEADAEAVKLLKKTGFAPEGIRLLLERLKIGANAKSAPLDDHPSPQERLDALDL